ncbi:MAG: acyl-CoA carboxylase subunit epsilon [Candidatus Nanopelagicales bacterium]
MTEELSIIRGNPTEDEIAIVIALAAHVDRVKEVVEPSQHSMWGHFTSTLRSAPPVGEGMWTRSIWGKR